MVNGSLAVLIHRRPPVPFTVLGSEGTDGGGEHQPPRRFLRPQATSEEVQGSLDCWFDDVRSDVVLPVFGDAEVHHGSNVEDPVAAVHGLVEAPFLQEVCLEYFQPGFMGLPQRLEVLRFG